METCCFTGHRDLPVQLLPRLEAALQTEVQRAIRQGYTHFLCGFARGADLLFAKVVAQECRTNPNIRLQAAIPYRARLKQLEADPETKPLLDVCSDVFVPSESYHPGVFMVRNRFMVDRSRLVIGLFSYGREGGGTIRTLQYALSQRKKIRSIVMSCFDPRKSGKDGYRLVATSKILFPEK